jgi:hypothetical protein
VLQGVLVSLRSAPRPRAFQKLLQRRPVHRAAGIAAIVGALSITAWLGQDTSYVPNDSIEEIALVSDLLIFMLLPVFLAIESIS